jgi:hypothetical protein
MLVEHLTVDRTSRIAWAGAGMATSGSSGVGGLGGRTPSSSTEGSRGRQPHPCRSAGYHPLRGLRTLSRQGAAPTKRTKPVIKIADHSPITMPVTSVRQAAAACDVSPPVVRRWLSQGLIGEPPWTVEQLQKVRDLNESEGRRRGNRAPHGTITRWNAGCSCVECRRFQSDTARGTRTAQSATAIARRSAPATPGRYLRWAAVSHCAPRPGTDAQSSLGTCQNRWRVVNGA